MGNRILLSIKRYSSPTREKIWYFKRLARMSFLEVLYRLILYIRKTYDKYYLFNKKTSIQVSSSLNLSSLFILSKDITSKDLGVWLLKLKVPFIEGAEAALKNKIDIFGQNFDFGEKIDWHYDPKTGKKWPLKFWHDIDIRDGFKIGGAKFVWEINRMYSLPVLGMAHRYTGEKKYANKFIALLNEWQNANPYSSGVNWTSGIELAIRIANLIWGISFLDGHNFTDKDKECINRFVWFHARHLFRYPSKYSSNNNHAIAEAFALFLAGIYFPYLEGANKWQKFGQQVIERECQRQILADGGSYEYTTTYLSFVFDFFLLFKIICDKYKIPYGKALNKRLERSCEYIFSLMDCSGNVPNIGDQDSAILVNFGIDNHENFKSILNTGAVLFDRPDFKQNNYPDFKTCVLVGSLLGGSKYSEHKSQEQRLSETGRNKSCLLKESGLAVIRGKINRTELVFVGNATPLGMPPLYAHGHLDALSFTLSFGGQEIFIDPGTYLYHSGGKWRRYFRSTAAHNTLRINEMDTTDMPGDFMFGKPYKITEHLLWEKDGKIVWRAGHDAYGKLKKPVFHTRQVIFDTQSGDFEIEDILVSSGTFKVEQFFHLHPNCILDLNEDKISVACGKLKCELYIDRRLKPQVFVGYEDPIMGWFSKSFNNLQESPTILCEGGFTGDIILRSRIKPVISTVSH